ncbi:MAG: MFS transporter [Pirellulales bacterium]
MSSSTNIASPLETVIRSAKRKTYLNVIFPLFLTSIIAYLDRVNLSYATLTMKQSLGFDEKILGLGAGIFFIGYVLFEIPGALLAERYSPKLWIARIMLSWGLVSGWLAFIHTEWEFYILRFLLGVAEASLYPVLYASCIPRWFSKQDRARAIALMLTSLQISSIVGAPLAGTLLDLTWAGLEGWQLLFLLEAIPAVLFAIILLFWMADSPEKARWLTHEERQFLLDQYRRENESTIAAGHYRVWDALRDREVLLLCSAYFLWITGFWGFNYWMPSVLQAASGWTNVAVGWTIVLPMGLSLAFMMWLGHHSSQTGEKRWHGASSMFLGAAGMALGPMTDNVILSFACLCLAAMGVYGAFGVWWSYPTTFLAGPAAAGAVGMINSFGNIGGFLGPYLTGFLKQTTGTFSYAWWFLAGSLFLAGLMMLHLGRSRRDQEQAR